MSVSNQNILYSLLLALLSFGLLGPLPGMPIKAESEISAALSLPAINAESASPALTEGAHAQPILSAYLADKYKRPLAQTEQIVRISFREGRALGLPPELILGIIAKESSFRPAAESGYGAKGLMQVVPRFHEKLLAKHAAGDPFNVDGNIKVGSRILKQYLDAAGGDLSKALARYSGGSHGYHAKVTSHWSEYKQVLLAANVVTVL